MKDLLNLMTVSEYVKEIMSIPLSEPKGKYNKEKEPAKPNTAARELSGYRALANRRRRLIKAIETETEFLALAAQRNPEIAESLKTRSKGLVQLYIDLSVTELKIRKTENTANAIKSPLAKKAVLYRYFTDISRPMPTWHETVCSLGIPLTGDELKAYVYKILNHEQKI